MNNLAANWSGTGDYTYTDSATDTTIRIYNIMVNPTIDDSLFLAHSINGLAFERLGTYPNFTFFVLPNLGRGRFLE